MTPAPIDNLLTSNSTIICDIKNMFFFIITTPPHPSLYLAKNYLTKRKPLLYRLEKLLYIPQEQRYSPLKTAVLCARSGIVCNNGIVEQ